MPVAGWSGRMTQAGAPNQLASLSRATPSRSAAASAPYRYRYVITLPHPAGEAWGRAQGSRGPRTFPGVGSDRVVWRRRPQLASPPGRVFQASTGWCASDERSIVLRGGSATLVLASMVLGGECLEIMPQTPTLSSTPVRRTGGPLKNCRRIQPLQCRRCAHWCVCLRTKVEACNT